jgi:hypothetical protein
VHSATHLGQGASGGSSAGVQGGSGGAGAGAGFNPAAASAQAGFGFDARELQQLADTLRPLAVLLGAYAKVLACSLPWSHVQVAVVPDGCMLQPWQVWCWGWASDLYLFIYLYIYIFIYLYIYLFTLGSGVSTFAVGCKGYVSLSDNQHAATQKGWREPLVV